MSIYSIRAFILGIFILLLASCIQPNETIERLLAETNAQPMTVLRQLDSLCDFSRLNRADKHNYAFLKAKAHYELKGARRQDTIHKKSAEYFLQNGELSKAAYLYLNVGTAYQKTRNYSYASLYYLEAEEIATELKDQALLFFVYSELGNLCLLNDDYESALVEFEKMLTTFRSHSKLNANLRNRRILRNLANGLLCTRQYEKSLQFFQQLLEQVSRTDDSLFVAEALHCLAYSLEKVGLREEAKSYTAKSLEYKGDSEIEMQNLFLLAEIYNREKKADSMEIALKKAAGSPALENINNREAYNYYLSELYLLKEDYREAIHYFKQYDAITDSTLVRKKRIHLARIKGDFRNMKMREEYLMTYNRYLLIGIISLSLSFLLVVLAVLFYRKMLHRKKQYIEAENFIERLNAVLDSNTAKLQDLLAENLEIERKIARLKSVSSEKNTIFLKRFSEIFGEKGTTWEPNWQEIYFAINTLYDDFKDRLLAVFPDLAEREIQLCCLMRAGFNTNDIAFMLEQSVFSIQKKKTLIRKKIGVAEGGDILRYLIEDCFPPKS